MKKIVLFDTSAIRGNPGELEVHSSDGWICAIAGPTHLELSDTDGKSDDEKKWRKVALERCDKYDIKTVLDYDNIVHAECNKNLRGIDFSSSFPLYDIKSEERLKNHRIGVTKDIFLDLKKAHLIKEHNDDEVAAWDRILESENNVCNISMSDLEKSMEDVKKEIIDGGSSLEKSDENMLKSLIIKLKEELQRKSPAAYSLLVIQGFINLLTKTKDSKKLTLILDGKKIKINKSFFSDLKIGAVCLPYIEKIITGDNAQYALLWKLFPIYSSKVKFV